MALREYFDKAAGKNVELIMRRPGDLRLAINAIHFGACKIECTSFSSCVRCRTIW
jgi:hypothetical protein